MYDLAAKELFSIVKFREGGRPVSVTHFFRPLTIGDWLEYERALDTRIVESDDQSEMRTQAVIAAERLWDAAALRVNGYGAPASSAVQGELCERFPADWKQKVPLQHKAAAVRGLQQAATSEPDEPVAGAAYEFDPDYVRIEIEAAQSGETHSGLVHCLRRPAPEDLKRFSQITSAAIWLRGAKQPTTLLPSRLKPLCDLYDRLIQSIEGYSGIDGSDAAAVRRAMDPVHKKVVIQSLFQEE
jgi:hypothetical protein